MFRRYTGISEHSIGQFDLNCDIAVPSTIHGYSLGVEYMREWFLEKFDKDFFKTIYINGKSVFDDYRKLSRKELLTIEKPALSIQSNMDWEYNRDYVDVHPGGLKQFAMRTHNYDKSFYRDYDACSFIGLHMRLMKINFIFRIRLSTRAQQIDIAEFMRLAFKIGQTDSAYADMDFHVPKEIMYHVANDAGFETDDNMNVKDVYGFLNHLNARSGLPFLYKFRTINGNSEFFIRASGIYLHISCLDSLSMDDGERQGQLDNNFHIEMNAELKIPVPQFYIYYTDHTLLLEKRKKRETVGLYNLRNIYEIPKVNDKGWPIYLTTDWDNDDKYLDTIDFSELMHNHDLQQVLTKTKDSGLSPEIFMEVVLYNNFKKVYIDIDWENYVMIVKAKLDQKRSNIGIYINLKYVNEQLIYINKMNDSRIG